LGNDRQPLRGNPAWIEPGLPEPASAAEQLANAKARAERH
jgi:hypothetical protein